MVSEDLNTNSSTDLVSENNSGINYNDSKPNNGYNYLIGSGDIIKIKFNDLEEYNGEFKVLNDGWIFFRLLEITLSKIKL